MPIHGIENKHCHYADKYRGAANSTCNLNSSIPEEILALNNGSNYDWFIKELAKDFEGEFNCTGENTEKYKIISVPIAKQVRRIDKMEKKITKTMPYKLQFIDNARFMTSSL